MSFAQQVPDTVIKEMCHHYVSGESITEIASHTGFDRTTVHYWLCKRGVPRRSNSQVKRCYHLREDAFAKIIDEATAYWLGFLFADGSVSVRRGGREKSIRLLLQEADRDHLKTFADFLGTDKPIRTVSNGNGLAVEITAYSARMADDLIRHGCIPNKSATMILKAPPLPHPLQRHFIRGVFDGDGSVFVGSDGIPNLSLCGNAAFLDAIRELILWHTRIEGRLHSHTISHAVAYLSYRGPRKANPVSNWLYENSTVFLRRKRDRVATFPAPKRYAGTVGHVSEATVRKYIANQKGK